MSRVLFIQAPSLLLNPTLEQELIDSHYASDPEAARSEWGGEFRGDLSQWLADELIDAALLVREDSGRRKSPVAFVDMSGGRHDASVLGIAHAEDVSRPGERLPLRLVLDVLEHVPAPHEPSAVVERFAKVLQDFKLQRVTGDRYAGAWVSDAFAKCGIRYDASELDKSAIYCEVLPLFSERRVQLIAHKRLVTELRLLERRPRSGGKGDLVDHPPRGHDDAANAACGALWLAAVRRQAMRINDAVLEAAGRRDGQQMFVADRR